MSSFEDGHVNHPETNRYDGFERFCKACLTKVDDSQCASCPAESWAWQRKSECDAGRFDYQDYDRRASGQDNFDRLERGG